jgi:WD40 repeat protein/uncharacterized protein YjbI with pentapeptide repeats/PAS domain-containing protein
MIVTCFSFKGGVGRSLTAVELAAQLAARGGRHPGQGARVLLWDLDLDAPGLHLFPDLAPVASELAKRANKKRNRPPLGTVDLLLNFQKSPQIDLADELRRTVISLENRAINLAGGHLDVLPAGFLGDGAAGTSYAESYASLDWQEILGPDGIGWPFFTGLATAARRDDGGAYRYVVIDSRTGMTDLSGLTTVELPDAAVIVFGLGEQNRQGLYQVHEAITRRRSNDRDRRAYLVASKVFSVGEFADQLTDVQTKTVNASLADLAAHNLSPIASIPFALEFAVDEIIPTLRGNAGLATHWEPLANTLIATVRQLAEQQEEAERQAPPTSKTQTDDLGEYEEVFGRNGRGKRSKRDLIADRARTFEQEVEELFRLQGWTVTKQSKQGSADTDLVLERRDGGFFRAAMVECKDGAQVGTPDMVQKLHFDAEEAGRERGFRFDTMLVTRSGFTAEAHATARRMFVQLKTLDDLLQDLVNPTPSITRSISEWEGTSEQVRYQDPTVRFEDDASGGGRPLLDEVRSWIERPGDQVLAVLGEFGMGKTTFCRRLAWELAAEFRDQLADHDSKAPVEIRAKAARPPKRWPILIDLKKFRTTEVSLDGIIGEWFRSQLRVEASPALVRRLSDEGRLVLIFDGFDEMLGYREPSRFMENLRTLLSAGQAKAKIIITSRTHLFRDDAEIEKWMHGGEALTTAGATQLYEELRKRNTRIAYLERFTDEQIGLYLDAALPEGGERATAKSLITSMLGLDELSRQPFLLRLIVEALPSLSAKTTTDQIGVTDLYELFVQQWLDHARSVLTTLSTDDYARLVEAVARAVWEDPDSGLHYSALPELARHALAGRSPTGLEAEKLDLEIRSALFLTRDSKGAYRFLHRSFLEFFVARSLVGQSSDDELRSALSARRFSPEVLEFSRGWEQKWQNLITCCAALLTEPPGAWSANAVLLAHSAGATPSGLQLSGVDLSDMDLTGWNAAGAQLNGARLDRAILERADLDEASLCGASLRSAVLDHSTMREADLSDTDLDHVSARGLNATKADLTNSSAPCSVWCGSHLGGAEILAVDSWANAGLAQLASGDPVKFLAASASVDIPDRVVTQIGHADWVWSVAWSPNSLHVVSGARDGSIKVWDRTTGVLICAMKNAGFTIWSVDWSPDGRLIASGGDNGTITVWDPTSGRVTTTIDNAHTGAVWSVAWSPDGDKLASGGMDGAVKVWNAATGQDVSTFNSEYFAGNWSVDWSPDGRHIAFGGLNGTIGVLDTTTGLSANIQQAHTLQTWTFVNWSPDGKRLASAGDGTVKVWDPVAITLMATLNNVNANPDRWETTTWSPNGLHIAHAGSSGAITVWDLTAGALTTIMNSKTPSGTLSLAWSPDGRHLVSSHTDGSVNFWDPISGVLSTTINSHHFAGMHQVAWSPNGNEFASGISDGSVKIMNPTVGLSETIVTAHRAGVLTIAWSPDGRHLASGASDGSIAVWNPARLFQSGLLATDIEKAHTGQVLSVAWSPSGSQLVSSGSDGTIKVWNPGAGTLTTTINDAHRGNANIHLGGVLAVAWSPDGDHFASAGEDGTVKVWVANSSTTTATIEGHAGGACSLAWSPAGEYLVSGGTDGSLLIWTASTGSVITIDDAHNGAVHSLAWSANGEVVSGGGDGRIRIWRPSVGFAPTTIDASENSVRSVSWATEGDQLAFGTEDGFGVWVQTKEGGFTTRNMPDGFVQSLIGHETTGVVCISPGARKRVRLVAGLTPYFLEDLQYFPDSPFAFRSSPITLADFVD